MSNRASPQFPAIRLPQYEKEPLPPVMLARLKHESGPALSDPVAATVAALERSKRLVTLKPGARVAVTCGSRGIQSKPLVVKTTVAWLKQKGFTPFIVPAMGSHGGAVAEGQVKLLAELGFTPEAMGCPIEATMEVVRLGTTSHGLPVYFDANAAKADAVIVINRVKAHTSFDREVESGLTKMVAIGLGKAQGARFVHRLGTVGYAEVIPEWARIAIANSPIAYGIAIVENAEKKPAAIEGAEPDQFYATDARLLGLAKSFIPRLPFQQIDVLVIERMGKNISGVGMDPAVTGRFDIRGLPNPPKPVINKLVLLGVTPEAHGNAIGIGAADYITKGVADDLDLYAMYMNACTSTFTERVRIPPVMADDKAAIQTAVATSWRTDGENARLCIAYSTLHLDQILVSPSLAEDLGKRGEIVSDPSPLRFDNDGRLESRCPH
ncbi:MAG: lactate racemase domain-containing protein [Alphaproteobacteria bacterium]